MQNNNEPITIELNGKFYTLQIKEFDSNIDFEGYLKIDHANIVGELITFPVIMNQIALLRAELESIASLKSLELKIYKANFEKEFKEVRTGSKTTNADVEAHLNSSNDFKVKNEELIKSQKHFQYLDGLYWSAQAKMNSLLKLTDKLQPEEFTSEVLSKSVNNVLIKKFNGNL